jgi:hypothetical protein
MGFPIIKTMDYLIILLVLVVIAMIEGINRKQKEQERLLLFIIMTQEEFDAQIEAMNASIDRLVEDVSAIGAAVTAESEQIANFINSQPPGVDTTALEGVQARLSAISDNIDTVAESVEGIFTPPAEG